jgi:hypothetical protein
MSTVSITLGPTRDCSRAPAGDPVTRVGERVVVVLSRARASVVLVATFLSPVMMIVSGKQMEATGVLGRAAWLVEPLAEVVAVLDLTLEHQNYQARRSRAV